MNSKCTDLLPCADPNIPLCIDLDGTLIKVDLLHEAVFNLIKRNVKYILLVLYWLLHGKAYFKWRVFSLTNIDASTLPYNIELIEFIRSYRKKSGQVILVTATPSIVAEKIASYLNIFDSVISSDSKTNLSGVNKANRLMAEFGNKGFDYVGNALADTQVWRASNVAYAANASKLAFIPSSSYKLSELPGVNKARSYKGWCKALRVHQWAKNFLVFVPIILSHHWDTISLFKSIMVFISFCMTASSIYVLNDLFDISSDRLHSTKQRRPFAAGNLTILDGIIIFICCILLDTIFLTYLSVATILTLGLYFIISISYSLMLKKVAIVDVIILALLYTVRIIAGGVAIGIDLSFWLILYSIFTFLSLALMKRVCEIIKQKYDMLKLMPGRGYTPNDREILTNFGVTSGFISILVLALYINSFDVSRLYHNPSMLWPVCIVYLYWIIRIWFLATKGKVNEDPIVFAIKDRASYLCALLLICSILLATYTI